MYRCIAHDCMGCRQYQLLHFKGGDAGLQAQCYCAHAGKP